MPNQIFCCKRHTFIYAYSRGMAAATLDPLTPMLSARTQQDMAEAITAAATTVADRMGLRHPEEGNPDG